MAVKPTEIDDSRLKLAARAVPGERLQYEICGFAVHSEVRLPIPELTRSVEFAPAWLIRMHESDVPAPLDPATQSASSSDGRQDIPGTAFTTCLDATGSWWWWDGVGTFHISTDARLVDVYSKSGVDERNLGLILTGPLASFVMYRLGHPTLHGSAVVTSQGAVMFLGAGASGNPRWPPRS